MTYHKGVPINDFRYLSGSSTLTLDWKDPWYSEFDKKALKRWQRGGVMSFLNIEPYEVRHEILARVKDLAAWIDLGLRGDEFIETGENEPLKKRVGEFFLQRDKTLIDGKQFDRIVDFKNFRFQILDCRTGHHFKYIKSTYLQGRSIIYQRGNNERSAIEEKDQRICKEYYSTL
jgi:hypothetical protein